MTPSLDYNQVHFSINTELGALHAEEADLQAQRQQIERRISEIAVREMKLRRVFDSLTDLLGAFD